MSEPEVGRTSGWIVALCIAIPLFYLWLGYYVEGSYGKNGFIPYYMTEWMTTYSGGFVRRGLLGQLLFWSADLFHASPIDVLEGVRVVAATTFLGFFGWGVHRNAKSLGTWGVTTILLCPMIAAFGWSDFGSVDLLFLVTCALNGLLAQRLERDAYFKAALIWIGIAGVFLGLSHEGFLLLGMPINVMISLRKLGRDQWKRVLTIYLAPLATCLVAMKFNGTPAQAEAIRLAWLDRNVDLPANSAVSYLGKSIKQEFGFVSIYFRLASIEKCVIAFLGSVASIALLYAWLPGAKWRWFRDLFLIPIVFTLPLYVIGIDWHRWVDIPFGSGIIAVLYSDELKERVQITYGKASVLAVAIVAGLFLRPIAPYFAGFRPFFGIAREIGFEINNHAESPG